jgi:UDP-N-acetylmuramoyl-tripeptide--D-alanyl-D-alanine ligase
MATPIPENRCSFSLGEAADACGGTLAGLADIRATSVSIDTRSCAPGALFVALRGNVDGHRFVDRAVEQRCAAVMVERGRAPIGVAAIEVDDTLAALGAIARAHLARVRDAGSLTVAAIGGAAGKTTTKELAAAAARALFGAVLSTPGNLNNRIGVPMTLFALDESHRAAVIECGTNRTGEIAALASIVEPDVAAVLNVDIEHTEGLGSIEGIADEESMLFATARRVGITAEFEAMILARIPAHLRRILFGSSRSADVRLASRSVLGNGRTRIFVEFEPSMVARGVDARLECEIRLAGAALAMNCAAAAAIAIAMLDAPASREQLDAIARALAQVEPVAGRMSVERIRGAIVIDDTYNSNPRSLNAALEAAVELRSASGGRLVLALGDILELGELAAEVHTSAFQSALDTAPAAIVAVGAEMPRAARASPNVTSQTEIATAADSDEAGKILARIVRPDDVVLVKGSRGIAMERAIAALR